VTLGFDLTDRDSDLGVSLTLDPPKTKTGKAQNRDFPVGTGLGAENVESKDYAATDFLRVSFGVVLSPFGG